MPRLDAIAAKDARGVLWVSVINVDATRPLEIVLKAPDFDSNSVEGRLLTGPRVDSVNTFNAKEVVTPRPLQLKDGRLQLPPHSIAVVGLKPR